LFHVFCPREDTKALTVLLFHSNSETQGLTAWKSSAQNKMYYVVSNQSL